MRLLKIAFLICFIASLHLSVNAQTKFTHVSLIQDMASQNYAYTYTLYSGAKKVNIVVCMCSSAEIAITYADKTTINIDLEFYSRGEKVKSSIKGKQIEDKALISLIEQVIKLTDKTSDFPKNSKRISLNSRHKPLVDLANYKIK